MRLQIWRKMVNSNRVGLIWFLHLAVRQVFSVSSMLFPISYGMAVNKIYNNIFIRCGKAAIVLLYPSLNIQS